MKKIAIVGALCMALLLTGCTTNSNTMPNSNNKSSSISQETGGKNTNSQGTIITQKIKLSADEAIKAYQKEYPNTAITSLDLGESFGTYFYEITGVDDTKEYSVKINAETSELSKEREEMLDNDEQNGVKKANEALDLSDILTIEAAAKIAVESVKSGEAIEWSLDRELTTTYWEVNVKNGQIETSVKLEAKTGEILATEVDD